VKNHSHSTAKVAGLNPAPATKGWLPFFLSRPRFATWGFWGQAHIQALSAEATLWVMKSQKIGIAEHLVQQAVLVAHFVIL